jgi:hypothetical protein
MLPADGPDDSGFPTSNTRPVEGRNARGATVVLYIIEASLLLWDTYSVSGRPLIASNPLHEWHVPMAHIVPIQLVSILSAAASLFDHTTDSIFSFRLMVVYSL